MNAPRPAQQRSSRQDAVAALKARASLLAGLARGADRRGDRRLRAIYAAALNELAELHVERLRERLP